MKHRLPEVHVRQRRTVSPAGDLLLDEVEEELPVRTPLPLRHRTPRRLHVVAARRHDLIRDMSRRDTRLDRLRLVFGVDEDQFDRLDHFPGPVPELPPSHVREEHLDPHLERQVRRRVEHLGHRVETAVTLREVSPPLFRERAVVHHVACQVTVPGDRRVVEQIVMNVHEPRDVNRSFRQFAPFETVDPRHDLLRRHLHRRAGGLKRLVLTLRPEAALIVRPPAYRHLERVAVVLWVELLRPGHLGSLSHRLPVLHVEAVSLRRVVAPYRAELPPEIEVLRDRVEHPPAYSVPLGIYLRVQVAVGEVTRLENRAGHDHREFVARLGQTLDRGVDLLFEVVHPVGVPCEFLLLEVVQDDEVRPVTLRPRRVGRRASERTRHPHGANRRPG